MTTTAQITQPDLEAHVWAQLAAMPGVTSFTYAAIFDHLQWVCAYSIQVDARAARKDAARELAEDVRRTLAGLPLVPWADGVVSLVQPVEGPLYLPDPEDGGPRYTARYEIRAHPRPGSPSAPIAAERATRTRRDKR